MIADHIENFWRPVGQLIFAHTMVETDLFVVLVKVSGLDPKVAQSIFKSDARIDKCKQTISRFLNARGSKINRVDDVFAQLTLISNVRNGFCHYRCYSEPASNSIVIDTSSLYAEQGVKNVVSYCDIIKMINDLQTTHFWIIYNLISEDDQLLLRDASEAPFEYKPVRQFQTNLQNQSNQSKQVRRPAS